MNRSLQTTLRRSCLLALLLAGILRASAATPSFAPVAVFETSSGAPFLSSTQFFSTPFNRFQFAFGFATDESLSPGVFLDSFTLTLTDRENSIASILANVDGSGLRWAPITPGTILLPAENLTFEPIPFPSFGTNYAQQHAYFVNVTLPEAFAGRELNLYADLFNNQNSVHSVGWISAVVVPEPSTIALAATALVMLCAFAWRKE
jgi:hypothetical protein